MNTFNSERPKIWNLGSQDNPPSPSETEVVSQEGPWKSFGTSMNAISFGFVATAILISMFLIMAIFEHLFKPSEPFSSSSHHHQGAAARSLGSPQMQKHQDPQRALTDTYSRDFSVLMPGQQYPTFIAQPAPLPCQREGASWPPHEHV